MIELVDFRQRFAAALEAAAAAQDEGNLRGIELGYEELDGLLPRGTDPDLAKLHVALAFWDGWIDSRNHDWLYYDGISAADWPVLARGIAQRLRDNHEIVDERILREFDARRRPEARSSWLLLGGVVTGVASLLHVAIIVGGPDWYRFFGAGEQMARLAAAGSAYPAIITAGIATVLAVWALYGLSGAGVIRPLPLLRLALVLIATVYLLRGVLGIPVVLLVDDPYTRQLKARMTFMVMTSAICFGLGLCYAIGAARLRARER